jgi:hypothetical protein
VKIQGPGASNLTIDGNNTFGIFEVDVDGTVVISNLTVFQGSLAGGGGLLLDTGTTIAGPPSRRAVLQ